MIDGSSLLRLGIIAALAVLVGEGTVAANAQEPMAEQCLDPAICPIPYMRLGKQETEPLLFLGNMMDEHHPRYRQYKDALRRFPDVRSCLVESERARPQPDLRRMDWGAVEHIAEIDTCVFRIATSIEDIDTIKAWLRHQDFRVLNDIKLRRDDYVPSSETEPMFFVNALLPVEEFRKIFPPFWLWKLIGFETVYNYSLSISVSQSGQIVGVSSSVSNK